MLKSETGIKRLENVMIKMLCGLGMRPTDARAIAWVYKTMTLRGVGHHDITAFPDLLRRLEAGTIPPRPRISTVLDRQAVAVMDGDGAPGTLAAYRATEKAIRKAGRYGIGMVTLRNSNHFLGAAPYALLAAEHNMLGIAASNTIPCMGTGSSKDHAIGNNPFGFAVSTGADFPIMLDVCNAYASYGELYRHKAAGHRVPTYWGLDSRGRETSDPAEILHGTPTPIGGHKGFGIALLVEILSSVLADGAITDDVSMKPEGGNGSSQVAIVINIEHFMPMRRFRSRTKTMIARLKAHVPLKRRQPIMLPGERSSQAAKTIKSDGLALDARTLGRLNEWAARLKITV